MEDAIEVEITHLPGGVASSDMRVLARMRLTPLKGGGHRIDVHSGEGATFWQSHGALDADGNDIWRLIEKAAAWVAAESEKHA